MTATNSNPVNSSSRLNLFGVKESRKQEIAAFTENDKEQIYKLAKEEVEFVPVALVKYVPTDKYGSLKSKQIEGVPEDNIPNLSADQRYDLSKEQIKKLQNTSAINALNDSQLIFLDSSQKKKLLPARAEPAEQKLTKELVEKYKRDQIVTLNRIEHIQLLQDKQFKHLRRYQIDLLTTPDLLNKLTPQQVEDHVPAERVKLITNARLVNELAKKAIHVSDAMVPHIANRKFESLNQPQQIRNIPVEKVNANLLIPDQYPHLSKEQVEGIRSGQVIRAFNKNASNQIQFIYPSMVKYLDPSLIPFLTRREQIAAIDPKNYHRLIPAQWKLVFVEDGVFGKLPKNDFMCIPESEFKRLVEFLTEKQIQQLDENDTKFLQRLPQSLLEHVPVKLIPHLHDSQYPLLKKREQIEGAIKYKKEQHLVASQVEFLEGSYGNLKTQHLIQAVPPSKLNSLSKDQLKLISKEQAKKIEEDKVIKKLPASMLSYIRKDVLEGWINKITEEQIQEVKDPKVLSLIIGDEKREKALSNRQVGLIPEADLKRLVSPNSIGKVDPKKVIHLIPEQYKHIIRSQAAEITDQAILEKLPDPLLSLRHLSLLSVPRLQKVQDRNLIQHIPVERIKDLSLKDNFYQIRHLTHKQVHDALLKKPPLPVDIFAALITSLLPVQLEALDVNKLPSDPAYIATYAPGEDILHRITNKTLLSNLPQVCIKDLKPEQVDLLTGKNLQYVTQEQIKDLRYSSLSKLPRDKFQYFTTKQKAYYWAQLIFKCTAAVAFLCLLGSLFHKPSKQWIETTLKNAYGFAVAFVKKQLKPS